MDKTSGARQQRYREQIVTGAKKRLQLVIDQAEAAKLDKICSIIGITSMRKKVRMLSHTSRKSLKEVWLKDLTNCTKEKDQLMIFRSKYSL